MFAALVRVLDALPANGLAASKPGEGGPHRAEYEKDFRDMAGALAAVQRADGFWNVSLADPTDFGGKETSGTALFVYGLAWRIRQKLLDEKTYRPIVARAWRALAEEALHADGYLGYVQGTGKQPSKGQPVTYDSKPDFTDYCLGCFLLAGWRSSG